MHLGRTTLIAAVLLTALPALAAPHARRGPTSHLFGRRGHTAAAKPASQRTIDAGRATQIQTALIQHGYLTGEPTGKWDTNTESALRKMQGDNGWQTKFTPDSRAIIKLGLGPGTAAPESSIATLPSSELSVQ